MKKFLMTIALGITANLAVGLAAGATPSCPKLNGSKLQEQWSYLRTDRSKLSPECITFAINQLGLAHYAPATDTLVAYLDFRIPGTDDQEKGAVSISRTRAWWEKYPAITALFEIGKSASPSLVHAIADAATSDLLRTNATETLIQIHREDMAEAVGLLNLASRAASDIPTSNRLWEAARKGAATCPAEIRARCEEARFIYNPQ